MTTAPYRALRNHSALGEYVDRSHAMSRSQGDSTRQLRGPGTPALVPGTMVGRYQIVLHLATGGMAEVWMARSLGVGGFSKIVALKTLLPAFALNTEFVEMFVHEASVAARLVHPGIVQIYDLGLIDRLYFIEMEYVSGVTLRQALQKVRRSGERLPRAPVLRTIVDCCDALDYAHQLDLIHRDISPENVMISELGQTKIVDFGIVASRAAPITRVGRVKGKYAYMAPEAFRGAPPHRSRDIYAIGVMLYELLTGRRPFEGEGDADLIYKIANAEIPSPRHHDPSLSPELERLIMHALARRPEDRPTSAAELGAALRAALGLEVARGADPSPARILALAGGPPKRPSLAPPQDEDLPMLSPDFEIDISTEDIDQAAELEAGACVPARSWSRPLPSERTERTAAALFAPIRPIMSAVDTGDLFPAVRVKTNQLGFDLFGAYRRKRSEEE